MANTFNGRVAILDTADNTLAGPGGPFFISGADFQEVGGSNPCTFTLQAVDGTTARTLAVARCAAGTAVAVELPGEYAPGLRFAVSGTGTPRIVVRLR